MAESRCSVVLNLDKAFENLMANTNASYPTRGQLSFMMACMQANSDEVIHPLCLRSFFRLAYMILIRRQSMERLWIKTAGYNRRPGSEIWIYVVF